MFFRLFLGLLISFCILEANGQKVEILAKNVEKQLNVIHAKNDVVLYSDKYIITADEAYYDQNSSDLELIGDITILEGSEFSTKSGYAKLNLKTDSGHLSPMFAYTGTSQLWLKCDNANFDDKYYMTRKSFISSCDVQDPEWKIGFSTGEYNREAKFMSMYNVLFYAGDVPVFYLPYFSFPTDKTRRSGLLRPSYGYSGGEGLYYLQPIYFAPMANWDLQIDPQIRTSRGTGVHATLRFIDSKYSTGEIKFGQFNEKEQYVIENDLKNDKHYGYSVEYDKSRLFSDFISSDTQDGLWVNFNYLNDINYLNTMDNEEKTYPSIVPSTLNYYMKKDLNYFGLYSKYYIETDEKEDDDKTIQELPTLHYHRVTNNIFLDNIFYSVDYKSTNYTSKTGIEAKTHQVNAPISIYFPLLNDFLHFKFTENFYMAKFDYEEGVNGDGGSTIQNSHKFSLYTELAKSYEDFFHTLYLSTDYIVPGQSKKSDFFIELEDAMLEDPTSKDLVEVRETVSVVSNEEESLNLNLVEYFYNTSGEKILSHAMRQSLFFSDFKYKYGDLENSLKVYFSKDLTIGNLLKYSHEHSRVSKFQTSVNLDIDEYKVAFLHTYLQDSRTDEKSNFLTFRLNTDYIKNYNFIAGMNYDIKDGFFKSWDAGWTMNKKCWNYRIVYREERTPNGSTDGYIKNRGVYLTFNLVPIGGIKYNFTKETGITE
jgi:LPS-assembly protein